MGTRTKMTVRCIGSWDIKPGNKGDWVKFEDDLMRHKEHVDETELLHSISTAPNKAVRIKAYLKVLKKETKDGHKAERSG